jgi:hypothetical protein
MASTDTMALRLREQTQRVLTQNSINCGSLNPIHSYSACRRTGALFDHEEKSMNNSIRPALAGLLTVLSFTVAISSAQENPGPHSGTSDVRPGVTAPPRGFDYYTRTPWFDSPGVREHMPLPAPQYETLTREYQQLWHRYNTGLSRMAKLTPEQRREREGDLRTEFEKDFAHTLDTTITDPVSRARYDQLYRQYRGYSAFRDPVLRQRLRLTPEQVRALDELDRDWHRRYGAWSVRYADKRPLVEEEFHESQALARDRLNLVLTPEQRATWDALIGPPYTFSPDVYFAPQELPKDKPVTGVVR